MIKHAILVGGHGDNADVLQKTIEILDDYDIALGIMSILWSGF